MSALFKYLATLADQPLGTLVHIGAGNGRDLDGYDALTPDRLVLVEGDSDAAAELQRRVAHLPWAEVHARPVAAQAGPLAWNRYTLPGLNGPLQTGTLSAFYPRLRLFESRTLDAVALPELLAGLSLELEPGRVHVLVLDVPGQEGSLLASLPQQQIVKFGFVLLRGVREALLPWGCAATLAVGQLRASCFDVMADAVEQEPLWPVTLLRFNAQRHQTEQLEQRLQSIQAALEASNKIAADRAAQIQQLTLARDEQAKLASEQTKLATDRQAQLESLTQAKAAADKTATERAAQIEQLNQAKAASDKTAADRAAQIQQLTQARDEQAKLAGEQTKLATDRQALMAERQTKIDALTKEKAQAISERDVLAKEKSTLVAARDEQTKLARDVNQRKTSLDAELAEISARYGLLQEELIKAEAQIELIADLLLRDSRA